MKPNEAPEKIYLTTFGFPICEPIPQESSNPDTVWSEKPYEGADSVKYTRTDAFIEKAVEWLKENIYQRVYKQGDCLGFPTAEFLEEFK